MLGNPYLNAKDNVKDTTDYNYLLQDFKAYPG